jgi:hypothetical protein
MRVYMRAYMCACVCLCVCVCVRVCVFSKPEDSVTGSEARSRSWAWRRAFSSSSLLRARARTHTHTHTHTQFKVVGRGEKRDGLQRRVVGVVDYCLTVLLHQRSPRARVGSARRA